MKHARPRRQWIALFSNWMTAASALLRPVTKAAIPAVEWVLGFAFGVVGGAVLAAAIFYINTAATG